MVRIQNTAKPEAVSALDMQRDIRLALSLADHAPSGPVAREVRGRLRDYITVLEDPAGRYATSLDTATRARDVAVSTIRYAHDLAHDPGGDPVASLRLLAKSTDCLLRYAASAPGPKAEA
ncbi:DUF6415 family natural product biosynthesis protein [Streptomyces sp. cg36]|uniref:DUF6415 family natural product biosynthesis protein n=1 Tax=Streptomyces sp. cg36 TaxID=3238798 RepID=UPI0034E28EBF